MTSYLDKKRAEELGKARDQIEVDMTESMGTTISQFGTEIKKIEMKINNVSKATDKAIAELEERKKEIKELADPNMQLIQKHIENIRLEQDKIIGKLLANKGIVEDRTASVDQIEQIITELDREIARIQADRDKATCDLEERLKIIRERLRSVENLDAMIAALNIEIMEITGNYDKEMLELEKEKLAILNRTDLTEEEKAELLAELEQKKEDIKEQHGMTLDDINQKKASALFALRGLKVDDETVDNMKNDLLDEINALEAMKLGASPSELVEINRRLALAKQQLEELELLRELNNRGLRLTPSGHIVTSSGRILTVEEAKRLGLLDGIDIDKLLLREKLKKLGIVVTESGRFISMSGRILTIDELKKMGLFDDAEIEKLLQPSRTISSASSVDEDLISSEDVKYLKAVVGKPLTLALADIVVKQPRDPIHYLGHWLFKYRYNQEIDEVKKKEILELEEERERLRKEQLHRDVEDAAKSCLLEIIFKAHDDASKEKFDELLRLEALSEGEEENDALTEEAKDVLGELGPPAGQRSRI